MGSALFDASTRLNRPVGFLVRALARLGQEGELRSPPGKLEGPLPPIYCKPGLLQLRVLSFSLLQDGDVGVGVFPEREEILVRRLGLGRVALHNIGSADLEMGEYSDGLVDYNSAMVEDFLELGGGFAALMRGQIGFASNKNGIQGSPTVNTGCRLS
jgi:hypothetical protein